MLEKIGINLLKRYNMKNFEFDNLKKKKIFEKFNSLKSDVRC